MSFSTSLSAYNVGDTVRLTFTVVTSTGGAVDTPVRLVVGASTDHGVAYTTSNLTRVSVGSWRKDLRVGEAGRWTYRWESSGAVVQVDEGAFAVSRVKAATA